MTATLIAKGRKLVATVAVPAWRGAFLRHRVAAGVEHRVVLRQLGEVRTVIDIGASRGQFALAARHFYPSARIVSFEPLPGPAAVYRSVFAGDGCVILHEAAIGPEAGKATMHISLRDDSSSLLPIAVGQRTLFPGTQEAGTAVVDIGPLAAYVAAEGIQSPGLLKLDVQGFELQSLAGCEDRLNYFKWAYVECSFIELYEEQALAKDVIAWLGERGFWLRGVYNLCYDNHGNAVQGDFLFEKSGLEMAR